MAKPIAGRNHFPFSIGGLMVDSAKIKGVTYTQTLYIYDQKSSFAFDLIEASTGKIFKDVHLTWVDSVGKNLFYYDSPLQISKTLPDNTFAKKVQDPSRNIFGFMVMYHIHKIKVSTGDYIFNPMDMEPKLLGVKIVPENSVIQKGQMIEIEAVFIPDDYPIMTGKWSSGDRAVVDTDELPMGYNTVGFVGRSRGKRQIYFTPDANPTLRAVATIEVQEDRTFGGYTIVPLIPEPRYLNAAGETVVFELIMLNPEDNEIEITEPLEFITKHGEYIELIDVSADNRFYTIKVKGASHPNPALGDDVYFSLRYMPPAQYVQNMYVANSLPIKVVESKDIPNVRYKLPIIVEENNSYVLNKYEYYPGTPDVTFPYTIVAESTGTPINNKTPIHFDTVTGVLTIGEFDDVQNTRDYISLFAKWVDKYGESKTLLLGRTQLAKRFVDCIIYEDTTNPILYGKPREIFAHEVRDGVSTPINILDSDDLYVNVTSGVLTPKSRYPVRTVLRPDLVGAITPFGTGYTSANCDVFSYGEEYIEPMGKFEVEIILPSIQDGQPGILPLYSRVTEEHRVFMVYGYVRMEGIGQIPKITVDFDDDTIVTQKHREEYESHLWHRSNELHIALRVLSPGTTNMNIYGDGEYLRSETIVVYSTEKK